MWIAKLYLQVLKYLISPEEVGKEEKVEKEREIDTRVADSDERIWNLIKSIHI